MENETALLNHKSILFVGKFSSDGAWQNKYASAAGDLVQRQIISELKAVSPAHKICYMSMEPNRIWPGGRLLSNGVHHSDGEFISFLNFPIVKNIIYAVKIFGRCLRLKPKIIIQYNSYLFENISILLYGKLFGAKTCQIVQDIRVGDEFNWFARQQDRLANLLLKHFQYVLPITQAVADEFSLDKDRYHVFNGGITHKGFQLLNSEVDFKEIAVFAGALERHNGIEKLINFWMDRSPELDLHIFGRGSLTPFVVKASQNNPRIKYHGFLPQDEIVEWQRSAKFNFCFRFSDGIKEEYFFPSKFFDLACAPGLLVVNNFKNLPSFMVGCSGVVEVVDEFNELIILSDETVKKLSAYRRAQVLGTSSWSSVLTTVIEKLSFCR